MNVYDRQGLDWSNGASWLWWGFCHFRTSVAAAATRWR